MTICAISWAAEGTVTMLAQGPRWRGFASQGDGVGGGGPDGRERSPQRAGYVSPRGTQRPCGPGGPSVPGPVGHRVPECAQGSDVLRRAVGLAGPGGAETRHDGVDEGVVRVEQLDLHLAKRLDGLLP